VVLDDELDKAHRPAASRHEYLVDYLVREGIRNRARRSLPQSSSRKRRIGFILIAIAGLSAVLSSTGPLMGLLDSNGCGGPASGGSSGPTSRSIALIDQMGGFDPDPSFVGTLRSIASTAGYGFEYYSPEAATIDTFIHLPSENYALILLRAHGTILLQGEPSTIAVSDQYSQSRRVEDQLSDRLMAVRVGNTTYFGLTAAFIADDLCGQFPHSLILAMGCATMAENYLASAFVQRGAQAFVGWNYGVSVIQTDTTFASLVGLLLTGKSLGPAVQTAMKEGGFDPSPATLLYYPDDQGSFGLPSQV
jgi:hypothetical protein